MKRKVKLGRPRKGEVRPKKPPKEKKVLELDPEVLKKLGIKVSSTNHYYKLGSEGQLSKRKLLKLLNDHKIQAKFKAATPLKLTSPLRSSAYSSFSRELSNNKKDLAHFLQVKLAENIAEFTAIFLEHHITRPFSDLHLILLQDLHFLATGHVYDVVEKRKRLELDLDMAKERSTFIGRLNDNIGNDEDGDEAHSKEALYGSLVSVLQAVLQKCVLQDVLQVSQASVLHDAASCIPDCTPCTCVASPHAPSCIQNKSSSHASTKEENEKLSNSQPSLGVGGVVDESIRINPLTSPIISEQKHDLDPVTNSSSKLNENSSNTSLKPPGEEKSTSTAFHTIGEEMYSPPGDLGVGEELVRLAVAAPRGHAKSTLVSLAFVLWCICYKMHKFILLISDTEDQAKLLLGAVKYEIETNEKLKAVYGDLMGLQYWGELALETSNGVRIQCRGTGQRVRGLKYRDQRPSLVICDDLESEELLDTEERRVKLKRWFYSSLLPSMSLDGKILVIGTILHEDALLPEVLEDWPSRKWAITKDGTVGGEPYWPEAFTSEKIHKMRDEYASRGVIDLFYKEYFNQIVSPDEAAFKKEDFQYVQAEELVDRMGRGENFKTFLTIDPAILTSKTHDYTSFCVTHVDSNNHIYVAEIIRGRWPITGTIDQLFRLVEEYNFAGIGMQNVDWERAFKVPVLAEMRRRNTFFRVTPLQTYSSLNKGLTNKKTRIQRLSPRYRAHQIFHIQNAQGIYFLEEELKLFPNSKFDDCSDSFSMCLDLIFPAQKKENKTKILFRFSDYANKVSGY